MFPASSLFINLSCTIRSNKLPIHAQCYHLQQQNTTVSRDMKLNLHVDNVISGGATEEEVVSYCKEPCSIMSSAKMNLCSWSLWSWMQLLLKMVWMMIVSQSASMEHQNRQTLLPLFRHMIIWWVLQDLSSLKSFRICCSGCYQQLWLCKVGWNEPIQDDLLKDWLEIASDLWVLWCSSYKEMKCYSSWQNPV